MESLQNLIEKARGPSKEEIKKQDLSLRRDRTILKYKETQERIAQIESKIERLQKEKENLLLKQGSRRDFLESLLEK